MSRGMRPMTAVMDNMYGKKRDYTPEDNESASLVMTRKFIAYLANENFFDTPVAPRMTRVQAEIFQQCLTLFVRKNRIMSTPVGPLCSRHIDCFISNLYEVQSKAGRQFSKFDVVAMLPDFKGADHV